MASFKKKKFTNPVICNHNNDIAKDWYVFFRFKYNGKEFKFKRREGVNRIKELSERLIAIEELQGELQFDLRNGWNPILDPKREVDYNPYLKSNSDGNFLNKKTKAQKKEELLNKYLLKVYK